MSFPLNNYIYEYKGNEVLVLETTLFYEVMILNYVNDHKNSKIETVNWFSFALNAKKLRKRKYII